MAPEIQSKESALQIQGYTVVQVKPTVRSTTSHFIYIREHKSAVTRAEWPQGRTLLVHNIPPYCNEDNVRHLFKDCGFIVRVYLQSKLSSKPIIPSKFISAPSHVGAQIAYVVFRKPGGVKNACNLRYDTEKFLSDAETPINAGLRAYIKQYEESVIDPAVLEKNAEEFMAEYYKTKDEERANDKAMEGKPDEDGFIKVTRHGKNKGLRRTEETEKKGHEHIRQRKKNNELKDFYVFQHRETKRKHIADLQAKFEEDKQKVKEMKMARKFRPY